MPWATNWADERHDGDHGQADYCQCSCDGRPCGRDVCRVDDEGNHGVGLARNRAVGDCVGQRVVLKICQNEADF